MTNYEKLVKALRCCKIHLPCKECPRYGSTGNLCISDLHDDAAAAIEELQAQLEDRTNQDEKDKILEDLRNVPVRPIGPIEPMRIEYLPKRGEIVRCGECKHHEDEEPGMVYCPKIVGSWVSENWYCADGERGGAGWSK